MKFVIGHEARQHVLEIRHRRKIAKLCGKVGTQAPFAVRDVRLDGSAPFNDIDDVFEVVAHEWIALAPRLECFKFRGEEGRC